MLLLKNNEILENKMLKTAFSMYSNVELFIIMWISQPMFFAAQDFYFGAFHYKMHVWWITIVLFMMGWRERRRLIVRVRFCVFLAAEADVSDF